MLRHERSAPIWLFSFVDLAFLLLIAFTQIDAPTADTAHDLATLDIPRIHGPGTPHERNATASPWQLRVHALRDDADRVWTIKWRQSRLFRATDRE